MILLIVATFYHVALGLQVVIEDYVHSEGAAGSALLIVDAACCVVLVVRGILAVLTLAFAA